MHRSLFALLLLSLPASARRGSSEEPKEELPQLRAALEAAGWTMTPERSAAYRVGDIYTAQGVLKARGTECFATDYQEELYTSYEVVQALEVGAKVPLGMVKVKAKGAQYKRLTFAEPYVRDLSEMAMEKNLTDDCRDFLENKQERGEDLSGWYVIGSVLMAEVKERLCREVEAGLDVRVAGVSGGVSESCEQGSEGHVAFAYKTRPISLLLASVVPVAEEPEPPASAPTVPAKNVAAIVPEIDIGRGLDVSGALEEQACQEAAQSGAASARRVRLDEAERELLANLTAAWASLSGAAADCLALDEVSARSPCIAAVEEFLASSRGVAVTLPEGFETVQTDCGSRPVPMAERARAVVAPEVGEAEALLTKLKTASVSVVVGPSDYPMVSIPAGRFTMGSRSSEKDRDDDEAQHEVTISQGFSMGAVEVTQGLWEAVMGSNPSSEEYKGVSLVGDDLPVQNVRWLDAVRFANALSKREGLEACYRISEDKATWPKGQDCGGYRLPTEAEWEYAARAGSSDRYAGTDEERSACRYANVGDATAKAKFSWTTVFNCDDGRAGLAPVGSYRANAWKLHDMTGNVWEWCWDRYQRDYQSDSSVDPVGPQSGSYRVFRGGSWDSTAWSVRVAHRYGLGPGLRRGNIGFRLARTDP